MNWEETNSAFGAPSLQSATSLLQTPPACTLNPKVPVPPTPTPTPMLLIFLSLKFVCDSLEETGGRVHWTDKALDLHRSGLESLSCCVTLRK